jgi:hypothetical protein
MGSLIGGFSRGEVRSRLWSLGGILRPGRLDGEEKRGGSGRGSRSTHGATKEGGPMAGKARGRWRWVVSGGRRQGIEWSH